jgi:hypothetical protein
MDRQLTEAFPWDEAPHYLIRDRDQIYGAIRVDDRRSDKQSITPTEASFS